MSKMERRTFLIATAIGASGGVVYLQRERSEMVPPIAGPPSGGGRVDTPTGTSTVTATPGAVLDLIVPEGETHTVLTGETEDYETAKVGGTVRNAGTIRVYGGS